MIVPDAPLHGARSTKRNLQTDFWNVFIQSVEEFNFLLRYACTTWGLNEESTVLVGNSMGGFISTGIFAHYLYEELLQHYAEENRTLLEFQEIPRMNQNPSHNYCMP